MSLLQTIINWAAGVFKIHPTAMRMFRISNEISGIDKNTLPTELIPLNSVQLSRGLLNFTILQSLSNWVFPYWAEKQYNPQEPSFIPRSHLGLSINITNRNWTAVGSPDSSIEPIVDPAGMVTPFIHGWSIDTWLKVNGRIYFPSRAKEISQRLIDNVPVVKTKFYFENIEMVLTTFIDDSELIHQAEIKNLSDQSKECEIIFAIRPFNPEGIAIIDDISYDKAANSFIINKNNKIFLKHKPDYIYCSDLKSGDSSALINNNCIEKRLSSSCLSGMSSSAAGFRTSLKAKEKYSTETFCFLEDQNQNSSRVHDSNKTLSFWKQILNKGAVIITPDEKINNLYTASVSSLLLLKDKNLITPGPFTYHQFWFRDAAYMIWALDKLGYSKYTREIILSFPEHQLKDGYFRSQKGEWDSNGQAIWTIYQHAMLSGNKEILNTLFDPMQKGIKWIGKTRLTSKEHMGKPYYGLMPAGLSAEHLGLADYYLWDNIWSIAGIEAFIEICKLLNYKDKEEYAANLLYSYKNDFLKAIENVQEKYGIEEIPASPTRNIDSGMIGSVCASYPLKVLSPFRNDIIALLDTLFEKFFYNGMFFQNFVHSGLNIYLTLQTAHAYLYAENRKKFWEIFTNVVNSASPTLNYPEAIHPVTGGGCMGDGHHGWASAEIVLALHEAFVFENTAQATGEKSLIFLQGIPIEWFTSGSNFKIKNAHTIAGIFSVECKIDDTNVTIGIDYVPFSRNDEFKWFIKLPFKLESVCQDQIPLDVKFIDGGSVVEIKPGNPYISIRFKRQ